MKIQGRDIKLGQAIKGFFPFHLLLSQLKYNLISLFFWFMLFSMIVDSLGYSFGIPLLFFSPEYLGDVSPWSFYLVGFALGGFIMGFNTYSYIRLGPHYPFLVTLDRPFFKFCINNSTLPFLFIVFYIVQIIRFQTSEEFASGGDIALYTLAFILGILSFLVLSTFYFFPLSKNSILNKETSTSTKPISSVIIKKQKWYNKFKKHKDRPFIYIGLKFRLHLSRNTKHLEQEVIEKVFAKNRINSSIYEILTISVFFILGLFSNQKIFEVPAAASIILLITVFLMLFSAIHSWLKGWVYIVLIGFIFMMEFMSTRSEMFNFTSYAYGLNYSNDSKAEYSIPRIKEIAHNDSLNKKTKAEYIQTLEAWKKSTGEEKPKLVIINTSGGGSRSALWTFTVLQQSNKHIGADFTKHLHLFTGASGGMIGASYFRQLMIEKEEGRIAHLNDSKYRQNISKDLLNRLAFMASTNDLFIRYQNFNYSGRTYLKDRGFAFEQQLIDNTGNILDHKLSYYLKYEKSGKIPTMIFTPTIVNDGRRLLISPQGLNFLTVGEDVTHTLNMSHENIDFHSLFKGQNSEDIRFTSVLRANATFPFVMPMVSMPTSPGIQLMDAGIRDNYGTKTTVEFLQSMKEWIEENTSGVIIVQIRDTKKILDNKTYKQVSFLDKIALPFNNIYKNFPRVQDFNQEELLLHSVQSLDFPVHVLAFNLRQKEEDRISLSWHLTSQEKIKIASAFNSEDNLKALYQLKELLEE